MGELSLGEVTIALAVLFALHAIVIVPFVRRQLATVNDAKKPKWAAVVLVFETSQLLSLAALISVVLTWAVLWVVTRGSGTSSVSVARTIERIQAADDLIGSFKLALWLWAFGLAAVGLYFWIARARRAQFTNARAALMQDKFNRLVEELNAGTLPPKDPTPEMSAMLEHVHKLESRIDETVGYLKDAQNEDQRSNLRTLLADIDGQRRSLLNTMVTTDLLRRIEIPPYDPDLIGAPPPARKFGQKLGRIFVSRGMFRQLSIGQRGLLVLNVFLAVPSLLTLTSHTLASDFAARITQLEQLRVGFVTQEAEARLNAALHAAVEPPVSEPPASNSNDSVSDQEFTKIAYTHAYAFENAIARSLEARYSGPAEVRLTRNAQTVLREQDARRRILAAAADRAMAPSGTPPQGSVPPPRERAVEVRGLVAGHSKDVVPLDQLAHRVAVLAADPSPHALTPAGESMAQEIITRGRNDVGFRRRIVQSFRTSGASFFEAARPAHLRAVLLAAALGGSSESAILTDVLTEPVRVAVETIEPGLSARSYQAHSRAYLATLFETGQADAAVKAVEALPDHHLTRNEIDVVRDTLASRIQSDAEMVAQLERFPPGLVEVRDGVTDMTARDAVLRRYYEAEIRRRQIEVPGARLAALVEEAPVSANFERYFPADSSGGAGGGGGGGGGGGRGASSAKGTPSAGRAAATRARSFVQLRGFARVGGVLIGREPEPGASLDIRDLQWTLQDRNLTLTLTGAGDRKVTVGPVRASVAHLALGYAADGRPLTVTMTKADPLRELRILLHPVLVDTPLGCRAIDIDRFVDEATSQSQARSFATELVEIQKSFYAAARIALIRAASFPANEAKALIDQDEIVAGLATSNGFKEVTEQVIENPALLTDPAVSPLKVKAGYYHPRIVRLVEACAKPGRNYSAYRQCLTSEAEGVVRSDRQLNAEKNINWTAPTPAFQTWSGVREKPYQLDPEFAFAGVSLAANGPPEPFEFIIQVAFTSPPYATREKPWFEDPNNDDDANDPSPWLFSDSGLKITSSVLDLIKRNGDKSDVFLGMREFVWLERLFRAGLSGGLGERFPIERLAELAEKTSPSVGSQRTLRWNVRPPEELALLFELLKSRANLGTGARQQADACLTSVGINPTFTSDGNDKAVEAAVMASRPRVDALSADAWDRACHFTEPQEIAAFSARVSDLRRLRIALGVREDEKMLAGNLKCGPL